MTTIPCDIPKCGGRALCSFTDAFGGTFYLCAEHSLERARRAAAKKGQAE